MQLSEESLFQAIKQDDTKAFGALMERTQCGAYRLGRFPVLSLMYLYRSRKLISAYEESFLKITNYEALDEPIEISKKFSSKAGKCLRLYLNEIVTPLEMLLILDKTTRLKRVYPLAKLTSSSIKGRLKAIYFIKYSLSVKFEGDDIVIDRRPLSYHEKKRIATVCLCVFLAVTIVIGVPVTTVSLIPKPIEGEVFKLSHIDFASQKEYTLKQDIVVPDNYYVDKVNCTIIGEGNKLIFGKGASFGELNGKMTDLTIDSSGDAIFKSISENAAIENVTFNVNADVTATAGGAFVAATNYGTIENVTVNVSGKIRATLTDVADDFIFGGIVQTNDYKIYAATQTVYRGTIKNCKVDYSQFSLEGEAGANASFGGVVGTNGGYVQDCNVSGEITADTFDIAGVCAVNNALLSGNVNEADLSQTSADTGWNPICCGIVMTNSYAVENCENSGNISAVSNCGEFETQEGYESTVSAAGIAYFNRGTTATPYIRNSVNSGEVKSSADYRNVYGAGVCVSSNGVIDSCENSGAVMLNANNGFDIYVGGITVITYGDIYKSMSKGAISATGSGEAFVGGISAQSCALISNCISSGDVTVKAQTVCAGGIVGFNEVTNYGSYVFFGTADQCISQSKISVEATGEAASYVGGIAGQAREAGFDNGDSMTFFGGCVTNCYFTGEFATNVLYSGNIVGACGKNIYELNAYYDTNDNEYHNFEGNYYATNSLKAFGATVEEDDKFENVEDKGATSLAVEEIQNLEGYKTILKIFGSL
ncbi:MAG: hypothetical protein K2O95_00830 [Clostridia bacterium]|nr:hypothetical protein [Clostridia bacterium]